MTAIVLTGWHAKLFVAWLTLLFGVLVFIVIAELAGWLADRVLRRYEHTLAELCTETENAEGPARNRPMPDRGAHEGPCLNYEGQNPEDYTEYDSCYLHIEAAEARWEALEEIRQRVADGWCLDRVTSEWWRPGGGAEAITPEQASVLWPTTEEET